MPEEVKKVLDELHGAVSELREADKKRSEEFEKRGAEYTDTQEKIDKINNVIDELQNEMRSMAKPRVPGKPDAEVDPERELRNRAFLNYLRVGRGEMASEEIRALAGTSDTDGGTLVPEDMSSEIISNAYDQAEVRPVCFASRTGRDSVSTPSLAKPVVAWGTKGLAVSDQDLTSGRKRIDINFVQALLLVDNDLLEDSDADMESQLVMMFSEAVAEAEDDAFVAGNGVDEPLGILTSSDIQSNAINSGIADALTDTTHNGFDVLMEAYYGLNKKYRRNATWAANSTTERVLRQVKDAEGRYLWQPPVQAGDPASLMGRPLVNPEGMPDIAANAFPIVVGDFSRYWIKDRADMTVQRLVERYAEYSQTGFKIRKRVGGRPILSEAFKPIKIAV
jgi:HK97 family phage major capsid protein